MCRDTLGNTRACGVCVKLKNLLKVHYKHTHANYTVCITITGRRHGTVGQRGYNTSTVPLPQSMHIPLVKFVKIERDPENVEYMKSDIVTNQGDSDYDTLTVSNQGDSDCDTLTETHSDVTNEALGADDSSNALRLDEHQLQYNLGDTLTQCEPLDDSYISGATCFCHCGIELRTVRELRMHERGHVHPENPATHPHQCSICQRRFAAVDALRKHLLIHGAHACICGAWLCSDDALQAHRKSHAGFTRTALKFSRMLSNPGDTMHIPGDTMHNSAEFSYADALNRHKDNIREIQEKQDNAPVRAQTGTRNKARRKMSSLECRICGRCFGKSSNLRSHLWRVHSLHDCFCGASFPNEQELKAHKETHLENSPYECRLCPRRFNRPSNLRTHLWRVHDLHQCYCGASFSNERDLKTHQQTHKEAHRHVCYVCDKRFGKSSNLRTHLRTHGLYDCHCSESFSNEADLKLHQETHREGYLHACRICGRRFSKSSNVRTHMKTHGMHECFCGELFSSSEGLEAHQDNHAPGALQAVRVHKMVRTKRQRAIGQPITTVAEVTWHSCSCGKQFETFSELKIHKQTHVVPQDPDMYPHACSICDRQCNRASNLRTHMRTHGVYGCFCGASFRNQDDLKTHRLIHVPLIEINETTQKCSIRSERFELANALHDHALIHKDQKPLICNVCEIVIPSNEALICHMTDVHKA